MEVKARDPALLARIERFTIGGPDTQVAFCHRLAAENGWTAAFAERVVGEYKRFLYLASTVGSASPSDAVDQAWHLHLLFTRSYWDDLCANILPRPLHHVPAIGTDGDGEMFRRWYLDTLEAYRREFGEEAPADVWPSPVQDEPHRYRRVNVARYWLLPRAGKRTLVAAATLLSAILLLALAG